MKPTVGSDSVRKGFSAAWRGKHFTSGDDGTVRLLLDTSFQLLSNADHEERGPF